MISVVLDGLAMPGDEESDLARGQTMVSHLSINSQPGNNLLSCAWLVTLYIFNYLFLQSFIPCFFLNTFSLLLWHMLRTTSNPYELNLGTPMESPSKISRVICGMARGKSLEVSPSAECCRHGILHHYQQDSESRRFSH